MKTMNECNDNSKPIVLVASCLRMVEVMPVAATGMEYLKAVRLAGARPLVIPGGDPSDIISLLDLADGIVLTGSPSNVHPTHFGQEVHDPSLPLDPMRDAWTLPLIREVIKRGIPLFAICRGFQEFNVALGGSLHQAVHELPGRMDHRPVNADSMEAKYSTTHTINLAPGGHLAEWLGKPQVTVNTVHGQGIDRLAPGLRAEAFASDGIIEAITVPDAPGFNLGVQWHPEWQAAENPVSRCLFEQFGKACASRRSGRDGE